MILVAVCVRGPVVESYIYVTFRADPVVVVPFPFVLSAVFVDVVPSFVLFVVVVSIVVSVDISIVLFHIESVLSLSLSYVPNLVLLLSLYSYLCFAQS